MLGTSIVNEHDMPWVAGWGYGGQRLFIVPLLDLVVAITAGLYDTAIEDRVVMGVFESYVLAAVRQ